MSWDSHRAAGQRAELVMGRLAELGITPGKKVLDTWKNYQRLGEKPKPVHRQDLVDAVLAGEPEAGLIELALREAAMPAIEEARLQARSQAAVAVVDELERAADDLHRQLAKLAEGHIETLNRAAAVDVPLDALVRAGRHDDAAAVAQADVAEKSLEMLIKVRERLWPRTRPAIDCSRFREAQAAGMGLLEGARRGYTLWYPSHSELMDHGSALAAAHYDEPAEVPA